MGCGDSADARVRAGRTVSLLEVEVLTVRFGGLTAVNEVSFSVEEGTIAGLIGPNGAGKTTCFSLITGFLPPSGGRARFRGRPLTRLPPPRLPPEPPPPPLPTLTPFPA